MPNHTVVSNEKWLKARKTLLAKERELTHLRDEVSRERRELPWVKVEKNYIFDTPSGKKKLSDLFRAINNDPEMKELAFKSGFELVNVGVEEMDAFMKEKTKLYQESGKRLGLGK